MANTASTTFPKSQPIPERSSRKYTATLVDMDGGTLDPGSVTSIKFSLREVSTDRIINDRNRVEVKNANGGSLASGGAFSMVWNADDTRALGTSKLQKRRALFEVAYDTGVENHEVYFYVENLEDVAEDVDAPRGLLALAGYAPSLAVAP
jgi:hypothetical protein